MDFFLKNQYSIFGASLDGTIDSHVFEVKYPITEKSLKLYLKPDRNVICSNVVNDFDK